MFHPLPNFADKIKHFLQLLSSISCDQILWAWPGPTNNGGREVLQGCQPLICTHCHLAALHCRAGPESFRAFSFVEEGGGS